MQSDFGYLSWLIPTFISTIMGILIFQNRAAFRKGKVEATAIGKSELNTNLVTNAIKEIEGLKIEVRRLNDQLQKKEIGDVRIEERIKYIIEKIDSLEQTVKESISQERHYTGSSSSGSSDSKGAYSRDRRESDHK